MKKLFLVSFLAIALTCLGACGEWLEASDNDKLDGYWKLTQIDTLATGHALDLSKQSRFLAVQGKILMLTDRGDGSQYIFQFSRTDSTLAVYDARLDNRDVGDTLLTDASVLHPFGFSKLEEKFTIETLNGSKLILASKLFRLRFTKF